MALMLLVGAAALLVFPDVSMQAASASCVLFTQSVLPGLYPYMILLLLLTDRMPASAPFGAWVLLGWGAGSPCGAKICSAKAETFTPQALRRLAVMCGTMSPMFLYGTLGQWLQSKPASLCVLVAVLGGGLAVGSLLPRGQVSPCQPRLSQTQPMTLGSAVEKASLTLLTVCGCMVLGNVLCSLIIVMFPSLPPFGRTVAACLLEVTTASRLLSQLPLPLPLRVGLLSAETSFGALAILLQNRAFYPQTLLPFPQQLILQLLHGIVSFGIGYGLGVLIL